MALRRFMVRIGVMFLSDEFSLLTDFLAPEPADALMQRLIEQAAWQDEFLQMFGRRVRSPRQVCCYGEPGIGYRYSGQDHRAEPWLPELAELRERLADVTGQLFNFVLLNLYQDQNDSMGWHADNEPELGDNPVIASVSLGAERTFTVRPRLVAAGERRRSRRLELPHGSLLLMRGRSQADYQHALPKSRLPCGPRLNLTFRTVLELPACASA